MVHSVRLARQADRDCRDGKAIEGEAALRPLEDVQREQIREATVGDFVAEWSSLLPAVDRAG